MNGNAYFYITWCKDIDSRCDRIWFIIYLEKWLGTVNQKKNTHKTCHKMDKRHYFGGIFGSNTFYGVEKGNKK